MAERNKPHNGRDRDGNRRVRQADVDDMLEEPGGTGFVRDDVRLGGAVADIGSQAGQHAQHLGDIISDNRDDVERATGRVRPVRGNGGTRGSGKRNGRR
jgi:hypothetical protein